MTSAPDANPYRSHHRKCLYRVEMEEGPGLRRFQIVGKFSGRIIKDGFRSRDECWNWLINHLGGRPGYEAET